MNEAPMKCRLFLVHWDVKEAEGLARGLRADGWQVDVEAEDGARAYKRIKAEPPDVIVIYLTRLPSHGGKMAEALISVWSTHQLPIVFVDGTREVAAKTRARIPNALYTTSAELKNTLTRFVK